MRSRSTVLGVLLLLMLAGACGRGQKVGSERLTAFEEQKQGRRLGERAPEPTPTGTPGALTVGEKPTQSPTPPPSPPPQQEQYFDVYLISDSPYYFDATNNQEATQFVVPAGFTLRVTNRDNTPERPKRTFTAKDGSFDSGSLRPGQVWTLKLDRPGFFDIIDKGLTFALATLEVRG